MMVLRGRIEICGGIASGKTTLAHVLAGCLRAELALERFASNPFFRLFYDDPSTFVYEKNVCFLAQHTGHIKEHRQGQGVICDYAVFQDVAYASLTGDPLHLAAMKALYTSLYGSLEKPAVIIHLRCSAETQLARIRARGRPEEQRITLDYLERLNRAIVAYRTLPGEVPVHEIDSGAVDFASDQGAAASMRAGVLSLLRL